MSSRVSFVSQEIGLPGAADTIRQFVQAPDTLLVGFVGSGLGIFVAAFSEATRQAVFGVMLLFWACWMMLGWLVALKQGEPFSMQKIQSGAVHIGASSVLCVLGVGLDILFAGGAPVASVAFAGFMAAAFAAKALVKGAYFHRGIQRLAERIVPGLAGLVDDADRKIIPSSSGDLPK